MLIYGNEMLINADVIPVLTDIIPQDECICALAALEADLFVLRDNCKDILVYDTTTFALRRSISVPGLGCSPYGMAACSANTCLYVSDYDNHKIHRVEMAPESSATMEWSVASSPRGLSVTKKSNVLVTCNGAHKLQV
jgi:DNA-binding beta-propeller fold protein YncE